MFEIILILLLGASVGWVAKRISIPIAVSQVLLGVVIGPPLLGLVETNKGLELLGELGVVLLLGMAGMHLGFGRLAQARWAGLWVAVFGMLLSFAGGYLFTTWWGVGHAEALYVGTTLTATSIGISIQVLHQLNLTDKKVGQVVIAAAVIDDVAALYLLALAHGMLTGSVSSVKIAGSMVFAAFLLALIFFACRLIIRAFIRKFPGSSSIYRLIVSILLICTFGWITEHYGYSLVVGGFFAGLGIGDGLEQPVRRKLVQQLEKIVFWLVPFFFVLIGTRAEWRVLGDPGMLILLVGLLLIAIGGKTIGGIFGAIGCGHLRNRALIGMSMVPRGEVALVIASLGFQQGHISHHMLVALVLMAIGAAILGPVFMTLLASNRNEKEGTHP